MLKHTGSPLAAAAEGREAAAAELGADGSSPRSPAQAPPPSGPGLVAHTDSSTGAIGAGAK